MDNNKRVYGLLEASNLNSLDGVSDYVKSFIEKLLSDVLLYVNESVSLKPIETISIIDGDMLIQQCVTGPRPLQIYINGSSEALTAFAEDYSHLGVNEYNILTQEIIMDFLNLHNGLFAVKLSMNDNLELSLTPPKQIEASAIEWNLINSITHVPISFSYGVIDFYICEV